MVNKEIHQIKILQGQMSPKEMIYKLAGGKDFIINKAIQNIKIHFDFP